MSNSIEVINLTKKYNLKTAVNNLNFKISENQMIGLLGPNGCGKTTTIGMILRLLKPSSGKVLINGLDIENNKISVLNKMNFISPYIELPKKLKVRQNLTVYGKLYNIDNLADRINFLASKLRLEDLLDKETGDFIRTFLEDYKNEKNISILLASHNMNEVKRLCDSVLMMKDGEIIDQGTPDNLIQKHGRQNLEEVFLKLIRN